MITPRLRPKLEMRVELPPQGLMDRIERRLREPGCPCLGLIAEGQIDLRMHPSERRFWSPQLSVIIRPEEAASRLVGHFGPDFHVWTMFLAAYGFVVLSAITGAFYGLSQLMVRETPWALWAVPVGLALVVLIYVAAGIGQRLGRDQVDVLQEFLERAVASDDGEETKRRRDGETK